MKTHLQLSVLWLLFPLFIITCTKDNDRVWEEMLLSMERCHEEITFQCSGMYTDTYFKGKINGVDFCVSADINNYRNINGIGVFGIAPVLNGQSTFNPAEQITGYFFGFRIKPKTIKILGTTSEYYEKEFLPAVSINTSAIPGDPISAEKLLDSLIKTGRKSLNNKKDFLRKPGFSFGIDWQCKTIHPELIKNPDNPAVYAVGSGYSSDFGIKDNYTFNIKEIEKIIGTHLITYRIKFEIACDLYQVHNKAFAGRLTDGEYQTVFNIPKE